MQVLELKPLKNKKLKLILVESEFPIDWALYAPSTEEGILGNLYFISRDYMNFMEDLVKKNKPDFAVEDRGMRSSEEKTSDEDEFIAIFRRKGISYEMVDIPEYALNYISSPINNKKALIKKFSAEIEEYKKRGQVHYNDPHFQQLVLWHQYLKEDCKAQEEELMFKVRESWMMMGILEIAKKIEKKEITALFICDKRHFDGIIFLCSELEITHEIINIKKVAKEIENKSSVEDVLKSSVLEIMPIKVKKKEKEDKIIYFFDTDEYCSPFDINMGYDAGFDAVIPYCKITADRVAKLVQDAMFSRKAGAPSVFFVGGSNVEEAEKVGEEVLKSLVPPFEYPVIIDPRGSHTTAAAVVAKTIEIAKKHGIKDLSGKKVVCLGGTGPVGQIAAIIASKLNAQAVITSRNEESAKELAKKLTIKAGKGARKIIGVGATNDEEYYQVVKDADVIWSVGKAGVQMLSTEVMNKLSPNKIIADINLVPPYGIEGMKPDFNDHELYPGIYAIGALDIGRLKYKVESMLFKKAVSAKGKQILDFNLAFELAYTILFNEPIKIAAA
jgi:methylene-tetrahydromethanopterin dehydrogenase